MGSAAWYNLAQAEVVVYAGSPEEHSNYDSIGQASLTPVPFWIWLVLPRLFPEKLPGIGGYTALGMTWEAGEELPIGFSKQPIGFSLEGMTRDAIAPANPGDEPTSSLTAPAPQFDWQGYVRFLGDSAKDPRFVADYIMDEIKYNHEFSLLGKLLYRYLIIPQTRQRLLDQQRM
ncbi:MAG: hypothetical protein F6K19_19635 [Cyanothece sp. SIO1E1]|nr:hypothetical protein [Cyanothece sp. SIO1E1]